MQNNNDTKELEKFKSHIVVEILEYLPSALEKFKMLSTVIKSGYEN
ncbi:MAG: hypothetical protein SGJ15_01690 [Bacteroidota bacterium]|nr:hypothetical protein [Bacteroidota bacterium]